MSSAKTAEKVVVLQTESKAVKAAKVEAPKAVKAPKAAKAVKAAKVEAPKAEAVEASVDYSKLTVAELKAIAKEKGITGISAMKKADLVAALTK
ncbi:MAG: hypothetical protein HP024_06055 [Acholeplasmatales bacterium]|nr:hypothetical protein [Acholeplasmatales bacterium]